MKLSAQLARSLRRLRARAGWSQLDAAAAARLNVRHYQKLEQGSVNATVQTLERLCRAYAVGVGELFGPQS